ncbi:proteasome subunit alpha type-5 [Tanacetum coccineum]
MCNNVVESVDHVFFGCDLSTDVWRLWNPDVYILKEDVGNVPVWVKLHGVPVTAFSEDGLSAIATILGIPLMLDSYTFDMCLQSWGRSSYARVIIELRVDVELKDNIEECPKNIRLGVAKNLKRPSQTSQGVPVAGNKKNGVAHTNEVSNSNPFDVLNSVDYDVEFGTNGGTTNLVNKGANSSGSVFMNVENSSTSYTPITDKIGKFEDLLIDGQAILVDC